MNIYTERKFLQAAVCIACLVPLSAGFLGAAQGVHFLDNGDINLDSHFRYLSGLLLGIGLGFAYIIPRIEKSSQTVTVLTAIVVVGGICRLFGMIMEGVPAHGMIAALIMELAVTPALCLWQRSFSKRFNAA